MCEIFRFFDAHDRNSIIIRNFVKNSSQSNSIMYNKETKIQKIDVRGESIMEFNENNNSFQNEDDNPMNQLNQEESAQWRNEVDQDSTESNQARSKLGEEKTENTETQTSTASEEANGSSIGVADGAVSEENEQEPKTAASESYATNEPTSDGEAAEENVSSSEEKETAQKSETQRCSCSYTPPYYVPDLTVSRDGAAPAPKPKKKRNKLWLVSIAALCVLLILAIGLLGGHLLTYHNAVPNQSGNNSATVYKNDGSITVNEIPSSTGYSNLSVAEVVQYVADSVVEITTSQVQNDNFFGNYVVSGAGSGVVISSNGYIITNNHVIDGATTITVRLTSGAEYAATLIGGDADSDVAVLKIEATDLKAAVLGKSSDLRVGQGVVAIGNPLGELGGTVTDGIISALDRKISVDGYPMTLLQTNAAINPGNSGGGLFNMAGELIGIVNAKQSDTGIEGLGFAIPIDVAWEKAGDLMQYGYVTGKVVLDFTVEAKTSNFAVSDGNSFWSNRYTFPAGVYVATTETDKLEKLDRIVSVNGITVNSITDFYSTVQDLKKGEELKLVVSRLDTSGLSAQFKEQTVTFTVRVTEVPA